MKTFIRSVVFCALFAGFAGISDQAQAKVATFLGSVIIGYDTNCTTAQQGAIRYNSSTAVWNYCNATAWTPFGAPCLNTSWTRSSVTYNPYSAITASSDGTKVVAVVSNGYIFTSTDGGATFTQRATSLNWSGVASSSDGTKLAAADKSPGYIWTSSNSGVTWTQQTGSGSRSWTALASSSDGTKLVATVSTGYIYTSTNSGVAWTQRATSQTWQSVASSADGTKLVAAVNNGYLYVSTDSGATWTQEGSSENWQAVSSSSDGSTLAAVSYGNAVWISKNSGSTWTNVITYGNFYGAFVSADGTKVAVTNAGNFFISTDGGTSFSVQGQVGSAYSFGALTGASDFSRLIALGGYNANTNYIYYRPTTCAP